MRELIVVSRNEKKKKELISFLSGLRQNLPQVNSGKFWRDLAHQNCKAILVGRIPIKLRTLKDYPNIPEIRETGRTFLANAKRKALVASRRTGALTLADDSGLEVEVLNGAPGVHSARFAGPRKDDRDNIKKLLKLLSGIPARKRRAEFICAIAIADKGRLIKTIEGRCEGRISFVPKGRYGFGYDPVFIIPRYKKTFAQLGPRIKNRISHRAKALSKARVFLRSYLKGD